MSDRIVDFHYSNIKKLPYPRNAQKEEISYQRMLEIARQVLRDADMFKKRPYPNMFNKLLSTKEITNE